MQMNWLSMMNFLSKNNWVLRSYTQVFLFLILLLFFQQSLLAKKSSLSINSEGMKLKVERVADGFGIPWGLAFLSPTKLLVTERSGSIFILNIDNSKKIKLKNTPKVLNDGQGGMLDVAIPPDFKTKGWIYFTYVKDDDGEGVTVLARSKLLNHKLTNWQELLVTESATDQSFHFGSRITFDNEGHVYFGIGDRGERPNAQDLSNHAGSIVRLNLDGSIPNDNPFITNKGVLPEIWSYGHRNPQGLAYDTKFNRLWEIEHGPRGGDEINLIEPAKNYGWPVISYGKEYWGPIAVGEGTHRNGMEQPVKVYIPSIAPGSLIVYTGDAFPKWKGNLFSGALKLRHINRIVLNEKGKTVKEERLLGNFDERIRALTQSPQGWLYFSTDSGKIFRIHPDVK